MRLPLRGCGEDGTQTLRWQGSTIRRRGAMGGMTVYWAPMMGIPSRLFHTPSHLALKQPTGYIHFTEKDNQMMIIKWLGTSAVQNFISLSSRTEPTYCEINHCVFLRTQVFLFAILFFYKSFLQCRAAIILIHFIHRSDHYNILLLPSFHVFGSKWLPSNSFSGLRQYINVNWKVNFLFYLFRSLTQHLFILCNISCLTKTKSSLSCVFRHKSLHIA